MAKFGETSTKRLAECDNDLQVLFNEVVKNFDCTIVCGYRGKNEQDKAFSDGMSKLKFPDSLHNKLPSQAVDVIPYPVDWKNTNRMRLFAGYVLGTAKQLKKIGLIQHEIRWGGDWDSDTETNDQRFDDLPHFELIK